MYASKQALNEENASPQQALLHISHENLGKNRPNVENKMYSINLKPQPIYPAAAENIAFSVRFSNEMVEKSEAHKCMKSLMSK